MNAQIVSSERRLRKGAEILERMEARGERDSRYERTLRHWLGLLAAYEYDCEVVDAGAEVAMAVGS